MGGIKAVNNRAIPEIDASAERAKTYQETKAQKSFAEVLETVKGQAGISLSKHARLRMTTRDITLDSGQVQRLSTAVERARQKGVQDTLVLMDDTAFVVNVKSTTVVTAAKYDTLKDKVFTNIDGAVIV